MQHFIHHRQKDRFIVDIFIYKGIRFKCACLELYWIACVKKHAVIEKSPREREKNNTENSLNYASNEDFQLALFVGNLLCLLQISMHFALLHINEMKKKNSRETQLTQMLLRNNHSILKHCFNQLVNSGR